MSTEFDVNGVPVGLRFFGGAERGAVLQMHLTREEFARLVQVEGMQVTSESDSPWGNLTEWFVTMSQACQVQWTTVTSLRAQAAELRSEGMLGQAAALENRADAASK